VHLLEEGPPSGRYEATALLASRGDASARDLAEVVS